MAERDRFEFDLAAALRAYLEDAPTEVRPTELARQFAAAYPHRRTVLSRWGFGLTPAMAWVLLLAGLLLALVMGGLVAGAWQPDHAVLIAPPAMFSRTGSMATARLGPTATLLADGRVLVAGGVGNSDLALASAEIYDPKTGMFDPTGSMTTARWHYTATLLPDGRVLVTGESSAVASGASAEIYDPKTGTFSPTGPMTTARQDHTATLLADGRVLVTGGRDGSECLASAEIYDPKTGTFSPTGPMTTARHYQTSTLLADGRVLIAGGYNGAPSASEYLDSAEIYDPKTGTFGPTGPMTTARAYHTATLLAGGRVLISGGEPAFWMPLASAEIYDPKTGTFGPTGPMTHSREFHTATLLADGRVLVTGDNSEGSADIFDP